MFVGRQRELAVLQRELNGAKPSLVVVYGRRRVGKSTLILRALEGRAHVYFQATRVTDPDSQELFRRQIGRALGSDPILDGLVGWEALLGYLQRQAEARYPGLTVVLDEFPYLCEANPALPSIVQKVWDGVRATGSPLNLILCGSSISFMEELLAERNPLHGRQSAELDVAPLSYREAAEFFPSWSPEDRLRAYGVFGGMPYYLSLCAPERTLADNIRDVILVDGAPLSEEPEHLLHAELQNVARYASILRAVADGCTQRSEILNRVLSKEEVGTSLTPYFHKLEALRLLRTEVSLDVRDPDRARNARFYLNDPFLAFHYRFVLPHGSALEAGHAQEVLEEVILPRLDHYMGERFEEICRDWVRLHGRERLPSSAREVGRIWGSDFDIDVAATLLNGEQAFGECTWWADPVGLNKLERLEESSARTRYRRRDGSPYYLLFARSGFTPELEARAGEDPRVILVTPRQLLGEQTRAC